MHGVSFVGKKDIRNLMLQYGDSSMPLQKSFPTIGLREMFYDPVKDYILIVKRILLVVCGSILRIS